MTEGDADIFVRLRATEPGRWRTVALAWRRWAALTGGLVADLTAGVARLSGVWSGRAATAAVAALARVRRRLALFRVLCWQADQAASEFAAALDRARRLLSRAFTAARRAGLTIAEDGTVRRAAATGAETVTGAEAATGAKAATGAEAVTGAEAGLAAAVDGRTAGRDGSAIVADLAAAVAVAARADSAAARRLGEIESVARIRLDSAGSVPADPGCAAAPAAIARWWAGLDPADRCRLLAADPGRVATLDGIPAADRDAANRLLLDDRRAEIDRALATAASGDRGRLRELRRGLDALTDRLAGDDGARTYLLRLGLSEEGQAVLALGDPDRADNVLTHVPGMTADLASAGGELSRAARVAERATELGPAESTSAVLWLDYDAPDFVDEAAGAARAEAGAPALHRFQEGLRASHEGLPARQTLIGHSYGSLVVGRAAAVAGLAADEVVFVGSPGVGAESVRDLAVPADRVWSSTSAGDVIQYAAVAPAALARDLAVSAALPISGPVLAFARPERDLWFGHNPSDPAFGAHVFASAPKAGHLGYWDRGSPSLDTLAAITLGTAG
jgi:hypothetical protein